MTQAEQLQFVATMTNELKEEMSKKIKSGRVPENWDGWELRQWFADRASGYAYNKMDRRRMKEYKNTCIVNNL